MTRTRLGKSSWGGGGGAPESGQVVALGGVLWRCEWHLRQERSNNMYLLPLFPLEEEGGGGAAQSASG